MKKPFHPIWLCLLIATLSFSRLGSIIHESDQASIILGSLRLTRGDASWLNPGFYEYGNYFLSYWVLAGVFKLFPQADPVLLANAISLGIFWLGAGVLLFSIQTKLSFGRSIAAFSALASPAVLVHLPYFAPNFVSAGLLFAGAGLFNISRRLFSASVLLWTLSFGCRMDGLLLIPLLAWLCAENPSLRELARSRRSWTLLGCGILTLLLGKILNGFAPSLSYVPFFIPKIYFAFLVFGAGGAFVLAILLVKTLIHEGNKQSEPDLRLFWWSAVPALLIPFIFYSALMTSPRHWVVFIAGLLMTVCSERTEKWWSEGGLRVAILLFFSLVPLGVGIHLPFVTRPSLTVREPTLFPTGDGRCPMGAIAPFLFSDQRLDHNQQIWEAARSVWCWNTVDGLVPLGTSQLFDIVRLAVFLNGQHTNERGQNSDHTPFFYLSSRELLKREVRLDKRTTVPLQTRLDHLDLEEIAGDFPVSLLQLSSSPDPSVPWTNLKKRILFLRQIFHGDEVAWIGFVPAGTLQLPKKYDGHPILFFGEQPFQITIAGTTLCSQQMVLSDCGGEFFYIRTLLLRNKSETISISHSVWGCSTIYPDYMSLRKL